MALLWADGFDNYGTSGLPSPAGVMARKYPTYAVQGSSYFNIQPGRWGGYSLAFGYDTTMYFITPKLPTTNDTLIIGFAVKFPTIANRDNFLNLYDDTTWGINLRQSLTELSIYRGSTLLGTTSGADIHAGNWHYIELKVKCHASAGTYEIKLGGVTIGSGTGLNTKTGTHDYYNRVGFAAISTTNSLYDDWYVCDASGTLNNTYLGNIKVATIRPDSAGDNTDFTPSSGSNYTCVDEQTSNDDTDYVEDGTATHKDLYNYGATPLTTINGIIVWTDCKETDAQNFSLKTVCKSGATESDDTAQLINSADYMTKRRVLETDPNTSSAWTQTDLNAAQFGIKVG